MKTILLSVISTVLLSVQLLHAQHFIDEAIIKEMRATQKPFQPDKKEIEQQKRGIYLWNAFQTFQSDVRVGFDKTDYKYGETITLTIERQSRLLPNQEDSLYFLISTSAAAVPQSEHFYLHKNERKKIKLDVTGFGQYSSMGISVYLQGRIPMNEEKLQYDVAFFNPNPVSKSIGSTVPAGTPGSVILTPMVEPRKMLDTTKQFTPKDGRVSFKWRIEI
jgi:hypothetical protein